MYDASSHCDACKLLSGAENTLNQMANEGDLKITKGTTKTYTYSGDSGLFPLVFTSTVLPISTTQSQHFASPSAFTDTPSLHVN